LEKASGSSW